MHKINSRLTFKHMNSPTCLNIPHELNHNLELSSFISSTLLWKTAYWIMHQSLSIPIKYSFAFTEATFSRTCFALIRAPSSAWNIRFTLQQRPLLFPSFLLASPHFFPQIWFVMTDTTTWIIMLTFITHTQHYHSWTWLGGLNSEQP